MINISSKGSFRKTDNFLKRMTTSDIFASLEQYGRLGVEALSSATPVDTGEAAHSWDYLLEKDKGTFSIYWTNSDVDSTGTPIVILLQYGHGTGTGGYVQGEDFINPAIRPIFDQIAEDVWKVVTKA